MRFSLIAAVLFGALLGVSILNPILWPLVFIGTILLLKTITSLSSCRQALRVAFIAGTVKSLIVLSWFWNIYPLDWIGDVSSMAQIAMIAGGWFSASLALGSGLLFFGYVYKRWLLELELGWRMIGSGLAWMISEVIGAIVFSIWTLGPGSTIQPYFSFGHTGYALVSHHLLFMIGVLGGVYGLSFLVGLISEGLHFLISRKNQQGIIIAVGLLIVMAFVPLVPFDFNSNEGEIFSRKIAIVETDLPRIGSPADLASEDKKAMLQSIISAAASSSADTVILPEDTRLTETFGGVVRTLETLKETLPNSLIIDSNRTEVNESTVLRAYIYDTANNAWYTFDKQYLVPHGEYLPYVYGLGYKIAANGEFKTAFSALSYVPGRSQSETYLPPYIPPVLFCFESVNPFGVALAERDREAPFVAHITSHSWFHRSPKTLENQLEAMLKVQARFNNQLILQSANNSAAKAFTPIGLMQKLTPVAGGNYWKLYIHSL